MTTSVAHCKKRSLQNANSDFFITFNYTDTLERIYGITNVLHIHGGVPSCSIIPPIMGHGNQYIIESYERKAEQANREAIRKVGPLFTADQKKTGVLASISLAQFILESGYGKSELA